MNTIARTRAGRRTGRDRIRRQFGASVRAAVGLLAVALAACGGGGSSDPIVRTLAEVVVVAGDLQTGTVGETLSASITVRLLSQDGAPVPGHAVSFVPRPGSGAVFAGVATSNAEGLASERWTLGTGAGVQQLEVRSVLPDGQARTWAVLEATARAAAPASIAFTAGAGSAPQLQPLPDPVVARVVDVHGNPCPDTGVEFSTADGGSLAPASTATGADGTAATIWTLGPALGWQTLLARSGASSASIQALATAAPPGEPARLIKLLGDGQHTPQHTLMGVQLRVVDALGNPVPDAELQFDVETLADYFDTLRVRSDAQGLASWEGHVHTAGDQIVRASTAGAADVRFTLHVTPAGEVFDGTYDFRATLSVPPEWSHIEAGLPTVFDRFLKDNAWQGYGETVDLATGHTSIKIRLGLDCSYQLDGQLTLDARGRAAAAGTLVHTCMGQPTGISGRWEAVRR